MLSTTKLFFLVVIAFILILVFIVGFNPFSFGEAYFRPRTNTPDASIEPQTIILPNDTKSTEMRIDR